MSARPQVPALIVGGTAAYGLDLSRWQPQGPSFSLETPFGPSPAITLLRPRHDAPAVAFCSRHGQRALKRSAAFLNPRALVWAAKLLGAHTIFSWNGVGAIAPELEVGDLLVPDAFIDFTRHRVTTFGLSDLAPASGPSFAPAARNAILEAMRKTGLTQRRKGAKDGQGEKSLTQRRKGAKGKEEERNLKTLTTKGTKVRRHEGEKSLTQRCEGAKGKESFFGPPSPVSGLRSTYVCTEGPRLETAAEIANFHRMGADVVGMTLSPEIFLAQELKIMYASLCYVTNFATGRALGREPRRQFGPVVAKTCLPILLEAAAPLSPPAGGGR